MKNPSVVRKIFVAGTGRQANKILDKVNKKYPDGFLLISCHIISKQMGFFKIV